jgi:hypothetical protein
MTTPRPVSHVYDDPLDRVWLEAARDIGWTVRRAPDAYASFDGAGTLTLTTAEHFDADDSVAQMVLHEICHALVAGPEADRLTDYGLENADDRDLVQEHATHRLQAFLAGRWGLRRVFAVTTDWRPYWDALPEDPLGDGRDPAIARARAGLARAGAPPFEASLRRAFARTRALVDIVAPALPANHLLRLADPPRVHPLGVAAGPRDARCGACAWFSAGRATPDTGRCLRHAGLPPRPRRTSAATLACHAWEPRLEEAGCLACGACCREAFGAVPVEARSRLHRLRPDMIRNDLDAFGPYLPRPDGRCVALIHTGQPASASHGPWRCTVYPDRPRACRDFAANSLNCLEARRRCGLS